ncbi:MAG: HAMP domain-containing histidine kinase [Anaerolineales bacterium]|nr:HAMP domain-containing histidine kinase [Anaerolineales bacterium]
MDEKPAGIWARIRKALSSPVFPGDEEKTRLAGMLNTILWIVLLMVLAFVLPAFIIAPVLQRILVGFVLVLVVVGMQVLMRRGHVRLAAIILSFVLFVVVSAGTYLLGGFRGSNLSAYFGIVLIAGLLLGNWAALASGVASIAFAGWLVYADAWGLLPSAPASTTPIAFWGEFSAVLIGMIGLLALVMTNLQRAYERAKRKENEMSFKLVESQQLAIWAQEASEFKSRLLARVSHELRTPLGAIVGMAEMLQMDTYGPLTDKQKELLERITVNSKYLETAFSELLEQSRIDKDVLNMQAASFSPARVLERVIPDLRKLAEQKGLEFAVQIAPDLPEKLWGVSISVEQILIHLIRNAIKFTETGSVLVDLYKVDEERWAMRVTDTGIGVPREYQVAIFEPFRQVDESTARKYGGVGLGLSIVKRLTAALGGVVRVESEPGQGSAFTVTLPYVEPGSLVKKG